MLNEKSKNRVKKHFVSNFSGQRKWSVMLVDENPTINKHKHICETKNVHSFRIQNNTRRNLVRNPEVFQIVWRVKEFSLELVRLDCKTVRLRDSKNGFWHVLCKDNFYKLAPFAETKQISWRVGIPFCKNQSKNRRNDSTGDGVSIGGNFRILSQRKNKLLVCKDTYMNKASYGWNQLKRSKNQANVI